jgi:hypothetical protein
MEMIHLPPLGPLGRRGDPFVFVFFVYKKKKMAKQLIAMGWMSRGVFNKI